MMSTSVLCLSRSGLLSMIDCGLGWRGRVVDGGLGWCGVWLWIPLRFSKARGLEFCQVFEGPGSDFCQVCKGPGPNFCKVFEGPGLDFC